MPLLSPIRPRAAGRGYWRGDCAGDSDSQLGPPPNRRSDGSRYCRRSRAWTAADADAVSGRAPPIPRRAWTDAAADSGRAPPRTAPVTVTIPVADTGRAPPGLSLPLLPSPMPAARRRTGAATAATTAADPVPGPPLMLTLIPAARPGAVTGAVPAAALLGAVATTAPAPVPAARAAPAR